MSTTHRPSTDEVYARLKAMLLDFSIPPGSRLTETELASMFDVSRTRYARCCSVWKPRG